MFVYKKTETIEYVKKVFYIIRKIQTLRVNNLRLFRIHNAKFSGYYLYFWLDGVIAPNQTKFPKACHLAGYPPPPPLIRIHTCAYQGRGTSRVLDTSILIWSPKLCVQTKEKLMQTNIRYLIKSSTQLCLHNLRHSSYIHVKHNPEFLIWLLDWPFLHITMYYLYNIIDFFCGNPN